MITLYRAVSQSERNDYFKRKEFRLAKNTLEAKQFFKSRIAIKQFVDSSVIQNYDPPYVYLLITNPPLNKKISVRFELKETNITLRYGNRRIKAILRGDSIKAMENFNADLTFFEPI